MLHRMRFPLVRCFFILRNNSKKMTPEQQNEPYTLAKIFLG